MCKKRVIFAETSPQKSWDVSSNYLKLFQGLSIPWGTFPERTSILCFSFILLVISCSIISYPPLSCLHHWFLSLSLQSLVLASCCILWMQLLAFHILHAFRGLNTHNSVQWFTGVDHPTIGDLHVDRIRDGRVCYRFFTGYKKNNTILAVHFAPFTFPCLLLKRQILDGCEHQPATIRVEKRFSHQHFVHPVPLN